MPKIEETVRVTYDKEELKTILREHFAEAGYGTNPEEVEFVIATKQDEDGYDYVEFTGARVTGKPTNGIT